MGVGGEKGCEEDRKTSSPIVQEGSCLRWLELDSRCLYISMTVQRYLRRGESRWGGRSGDRKCVVRNRGIPVHQFKRLNIERFLGRALIRSRALEVVLSSLGEAHGRVWLECLGYDLSFPPFLRTGRD